MYGIVMMTAMTAGVDAPAFHPHSRPAMGCYGCGAGCFGSSYGLLAGCYGCRATATSTAAASSATTAPRATAVRA